MGTPMVEFLSFWFAHSGINPLILSRGYAGGDEVKMLERHLLGTSVKVGIGANRAMTAAWFLQRYGYLDSHVNGFFGNLLSPKKVQTDAPSDKIGVTILDDGMQVSEQNLINLKRSIQEMNDNLPVFFSKMAPAHCLSIQNRHTKVPLSAVESRVLLCVSAIASPDTFLKCIQKLGPLHVDKLHYSDHYFFQSKDIGVMKKRLEELQQSFGTKPIVVATEKDYDRDHEVLLRLHPFDVLVLCSHLQIMPYSSSSEEGFKEHLKQLLELRLERRKQIDQP